MKTEKLLFKNFLVNNYKACSSILPIMTKNEAIRFKKQYGKYVVSIEYWRGTSEVAIQSEEYGNYCCCFKTRVIIFDKFFRKLQSIFGDNRLKDIIIRIILEHI